MLKKAYELLKLQDRKVFGYLIILLNIGAIFELFSVFIIVNTISMLSNDDYFINSMSTIINYIGETAYLGIGICICSLSGLLKLYNIKKSTHFVNSQRHSMSARLLEFYSSQTDIKKLSNPSDTVKSVLSEVDTVVITVYQPLLNIATHSTIVFLLILAMLYKNITVSIIAISVVCLSYLAVYAYKKSHISKISYIRLKANTERYQAPIFLLQNLLSIKAFGIRKYYLKKFNGPSKSYSDSMADAQFIAQSPKILIETVLIMLILCIILVIIQNDRSDEPLEHIIIDIVFFLVATGRLIPSAQSIYHAFSQFRFGKSALLPIYDMLITKNVTKSKNKNQEICDIRSIKLHSVNIKGADYDIYSKDINYKFLRGNTYLIEGPSGSGKSTLLSILMGNLHPDVGSVEINQVPIQNLDLENLWFNHFAIVDQNPIVFTATLRENLINSSFRRLPTEKELKGCLQLCELTDVWKRFNDGEGHVDEVGSGLSGGELQRIALCRALLKNTDVLILDEFTSALDLALELRIVDGMSQYLQNKITFIVSHRQTPQLLANKRIELVNV
mgnify:CR=1 FL=1